MFQAHGTRKRRRRSAVDQGSILSNDNTVLVDLLLNPQSGPSQPKGILEGVVACLSGLTPDEKDRYHNLITSLGGSYTRDFNLQRNTHLISSEARGAKYESARASSTPRVHIVRPSWLDDCLRRRERVDEGAHAFAVPVGGEHRARHPTLQCQTDEASHYALGEQLDRLLSSSCDQISDLFSGCHIHLVGFDTDHDRPLILKIGKLIRRGMGTIYWDFQEDTITHVIVNVGASTLILDATKALQGTCGFDCVSPWWIVCSWSSGWLGNPTDHPPIYCAVEAPQKEERPPTNKTVSSTLWKGTIFCLLRVVPPSWAVDFDPNELETLIRTNGGQLLSQKMMEALKVDQAPGKSNPNASLTLTASCSAKRTCYVIGWGGYSSSHLDIHPLLSQVKRHALCHVVEVTPIWLLACQSEQRLILPTSRNPDLFVPGKRPIHRLGDLVVPRSSQSTALNGKADKARPLRISVTGFSGSTRSALVHAIQALGVAYDDAMHTSTTHLICREAKGQKYAKAVEWGIQCVSMDWLYHVMKYGYQGERGDPGGCEATFPVRLN